MASSYASAVASKADLVQEIISWLPPKSVIRFKSVCSKWRDIISTPYFISTHTCRNPHKPSGILFSVSRIHLARFLTVHASCPLDGGVPRVFPEDRSLDASVRCFFLHCSNGLLLTMQIELFVDSVPLHVYNPTTGQRRILPETDIDPNTITAVLAFDPSRSTNYHVLVACSDHPGEIKVYHSATDSSWKTFGMIGSSLSTHSCFSGGVVYWLDNDESLITVDIQQERIKETGTRPPMEEECHTLSLYESRGRLHLLWSKFSLLHLSGIMQIFELENDHSRWLPRHHVSMEDLLNHGKNLQQPAPSLDLVWNKYINLTRNCLAVEGDQDDKLVVLTGNKLVAYDFRSKTHVTLCSNDPETVVYLGFACANTLVAP